MVKLNSNKLSVGDKLSRTSYMTVKTIRQIGRNKVIDVENEDGFGWDIVADIVEKECYSHNQFDTTVELSRTELIQKFSEVGDAVFTVNFDKLATAEDYLEIARGEGGKIISHAEMTKRFKKFKGENRTLVGYLVKVENGFGRSTVIDLEIAGDQHRVRQVDHRTINWLIVKNVKYTVKK